METVADIKVTENAAKQIKTLLNDSEDRKGRALRVYVEAGGCSGMQYGMTFDEKKSDDIEIQQDDVSVIIDPQSLDFLKGSVIDYTESIQGSGFRIQNPNAKTACGCGKSFH